VRAARRGPRESRVVASVLAYLAHLPGCFAWRNNSGVARIGGRVVRFGGVGSADILCCYRGRFIGVECKAAGGRQSPLQARWQKKLEAAGGLYFLARSVEDVSEAVRAVV